MALRAIDSNIIVINKETDSAMHDAYAKEIMRFGPQHLCMGKISKGFLEESLDMCEYLFVHMFGEEIRGFACVYEVTTPSHYLYVDLICNAPFHKMATRETGESTKYGGKHLLHAIKEKGLELGVESIKLSALEHVVTYYNYLGYQLMGTKQQEALATDLMKKLQKAQREHDKHAVDNIFSKMVGRFYPGFYSEAKQREFAEYRVGDERKDAVREDGIPMILYLHKKGGKRSSKRKTQKKTKRKHRHSKRKVRKYTRSRKRNAKTRRK